MSCAAPTEWTSAGMVGSIITAGDGHSWAAISMAHDLPEPGLLLVNSSRGEVRNTSRPLASRQWLCMHHSAVVSSAASLGNWIM